MRTFSPLSSPYARILGVTFLPVSTYNSSKKRGVEMELILIGADKLKVMLTEEDMKFYAIEFERLDYGNTETRRAIWSILDEAKRQIGFDAARDRIYIQAYKNITGGCELFVSCTDTGKKTVGIKKLLYRFDSMDSLLCACRLISGRYSGGSAAFSSDDGRFFLLLEETAPRRSSPDALSSLEEFGRAMPCREEYLREHAKLICRGAVTLLGSLK